jgi:glycosyltransferase involved in cell wall biosynthesis
MPLMFALACISGRRVFLVSEGFRSRKANWYLRLLFAVVSLFRGGQLLAIGNTAADDFRRAGLMWPIRRFGFSEPTPGQIGQVPLKHSSSSRPINLLVAGQLIPRKKIDWLFQSIAVHQCRDKVVIHVCGDGPDRKMLSSLAQGLQINAIFHGFVSGQRLAEQFIHADIFIHPAVYEGWGVVLNHALAYGLPIIAYTGVRSADGILVKEGINGYVFHDDSTFSQALEKLVTNKELREKFSSASKALSNTWSVDFIGNRLSRLLIDGDQDWGDESPLSKISNP